MPKLDNPASRLLRLMQKAKGCGKTLKISDVWVTALGIDSDKKLFRELTLAQRACENAQKEILRLEGLDLALYLKPYANIEKVISFSNMDHLWQTCEQYLDVATMDVLAIGADLLSRYRSEGEIAEASLRELDIEVTQHFRETSDLRDPEEFGSTLTEMLKSLHRSIGAYYLLGPPGLAETHAQCLGVVLRRREQFIRRVSLPQVSSFLKVLKKLDDLLVGTGRHAPLSGEALAFIGLTKV